MKKISLYLSSLCLVVFSVGRLKTEAEVAQQAAASTKNAAIA